MRKMMMMGTAAAALLSLAPALASAQESGFSASGRIDYSNRVDATVDVDSYLDKDLTLFGGTLALGLVVTDSAAVAIVDNKQVLTDNSVAFREETADDGNGFVNAIFGEGDDEEGVSTGENIEVGFFAPVVNTVNDFDVQGAAGNVGINMAAGQYNMQENVAAIAASNYNDLNTDGDGDVTGHTGGWASASLISLQFASGNTYGPDDLVEPDDEAETEDGFQHNHYRERNTVGAEEVDAVGNLGLNAAAGAFNIQKNALVIAVVADSALAEANAAVIQTSLGNSYIGNDTENTVAGLSVGSAATGNIGINLAAGVGNIQQNSLVMALASGAAAPPPPPNGGGNGGTNGGGNGGNGGGD